MARLDYTELKMFLTSLGGLEVLLVGPVGLGVRPDQVVRGLVHAGCNLLDAGSVVADPVALHGGHPRLVEGQPILDLCNIRGSIR